MTKTSWLDRIGYAGSNEATLANDNIILLGEFDIYIHAFDMFVVPKIGTSIAPVGP